MDQEPAAVEELIAYLEKRRAYIPNYQQRQRAGLWIASTRVEKYNDWAVSARCKHQGMSWSPQGVLALAAWKPRGGTVNSTLGVGTVPFRSVRYRNRFARPLDRGTGGPRTGAQGILSGGITPDPALGPAHRDEGRAPPRRMSHARTGSAARRRRSCS